jgi:L-arabinokinase
MRIAFYISGHGFGHASRDVELINTIAASRPGVRIFVRTAAPRWLFAAARADLTVDTVDADSGLVQLDSLRFDEPASIALAAEFYDSFDERVEREARILRDLHADLVVADIPPLAFAAAERAGVPSIALGNFTWDWIYGAYENFRTAAPSVIPTIRAAYATATRALRLPFHGGFEPMASVVDDIPLIARQSRRDPAETRDALGIRDDRPVVLASFGAYGAPLPWDVIRKNNDLSLIAFEKEPPPGFQYQDLVAAADLVVSKPGYGIVSECIANDTALLYTSRGRFIEYDLFVAEMPRVLRCRWIAQEDLLAGRWRDAIAALLTQPKAPELYRVDGAEVAAREILNY